MCMILIQKVFPYLEELASTETCYPRWPIALENVLRIKYPAEPSNGEYEQVAR